MRRAVLGVVALSAIVGLTVPSVAGTITPPPLNPVTVTPPSTGCPPSDPSDPQLCDPYFTGPSATVDPTYPTRLPDWATDTIGHG